MTHFFFTLHDRSIDRNVNTALAKAGKFVLNSSLYLRTHFHSYKYIAEIEYEMKTHQSRGINTDQNFKIDQKKKKRQHYDVNYNLLLWTANTTGFQDL